MAFTKESFVDGQVLTAANMNNIVEGISRKMTVYQSEQSIVELLSLDEKEALFKGFCGVNISKLTNPITQYSNRNNLYKLDISKIVQVFGNSVKSAIEQIIGNAVKNCGLIITKLVIRESSGLLANGLYSWNVPIGQSLSTFTYSPPDPDVSYMVVTPWIENFPESIQQGIDTIAADSNSKFLVDFYLLHSVTNS